jgi:hypothetical protein
VTECNTWQTLHFLNLHPHNGTELLWNCPSPWQRAQPFSSMTPFCPLTCSVFLFFLFSLSQIPLKAGTAHNHLMLITKTTLQAKIVIYLSPKDPQQDPAEPVLRVKQLMEYFWSTLVIPLYNCRTTDSMRKTIFLRDGSLFLSLPPFPSLPLSLSPCTLEAVGGQTWSVETPRVRPRSWGSSDNNFPYFTSRSAEPAVYSKSSWDCFSLFALFYHCKIRNKFNTTRTNTAPHVCEPVSAHSFYLI